MDRPKRPIWPWIVGALILIGMFGAGPALKFVKSAKQTLETENLLIVQNNRLYHLTQNWGREGKYKVVQQPSDKGFAVKPRSNQIDIDDHGDVYTKNLLVQECRYMPKSQKLYFSALESPPPRPNQRHVAGYRLWCWSKKDGFQALTPAVDYVGGFCPTFDGNTLYLRVSTHTDPWSYTQIDCKTNKFSPFSLPKDAVNLEAVIDANTILYAKTIQNPNSDESEQQLWVYNLNSKKTNRVLPSRRLDRAIIFEGHLWAMDHLDGKATPIELNKDLTIHK